MLVSQSSLNQDSLKDEVVIVTGAGRGIGYEAARALIWLGAKAVIAEVDEQNGKEAAKRLELEFGDEKVFFVKTDVGSEKDIERLAKEVFHKWGKVDVILNSATVFPMGEVKDTPIEKWDFSYHVNLRGPVLLAKTFLPAMIKRKHGVFVSVSSSGAVPFMGAYEVFKTAQGELAGTISAETEGEGVYAFTIGPGIVKTPGFIDGGGQVASHMGITLDDLLEMNKNFEISPEAAGTGFAAAIAQAPKYNGQETSSIQVLREVGIALGGEQPQKTEPVEAVSKEPSGVDANLEELFKRIMKTYSEQSDGWKKRNLFERQWVFRDFKKNTGMSTDEMLTALKTLENNLSKQTPSKESFETLRKLEAYYKHQQDQLRGFEKDPEKLKKNLEIIQGWISEIELFIKSSTVNSH